MKTKPERNKALYLDRVKNNMTFDELGKKYGISGSRAKVIFDRERWERSKSQGNSWDPGRPLTIDEAYYWYK